MNAIVKMVEKYAKENNLETETAAERFLNMDMYKWTDWEVKWLQIMADGGNIGFTE